MNIEHIPVEMRQVRRWVGRCEDKTPINPRTLKGAQSTTPSTWGTLSEAVNCIGKMATYNKGETTAEIVGIGFVLGDGWAGADLDTVFDPSTGELAADAQSIISELSTYTEVSPSGYGFHCIARVDADTKFPGNRFDLMPNGIHRTDSTGKVKRPELELYTSGRYFTITGDIYGDKRTAEERADIMCAIAQRYADKKKKPEPVATTQSYIPVSLSDSELIDKIRKSRNADLFNRLWSGNIADFGDRSAADMSLCNILAFWTQKDVAQIDRLFRQSGLMRSKWDERHYSDGRTYGQATIATAIRDCTAVYEPRKDTMQYRESARHVEENTDSFLACFKTLDEFSEEEATWTVPGWIPEGQITLLAADGGIGKTTLWVNIIASMSSGQPCVLDPQGHTREPQKVAFLTTEDSVRKKLKKKLREAGANMSNIVTLDFAADKDGLLRDLKFGSPKLEQFIKCFRPALCVFDPVQGFIPRNTNMGSRNEMRDCLSQLITLGEETGTTFLVICHTNKRKAAFGRDRVADSADLWDISRSVLMAGYTETQGIRYLSNEKNNYTTEQETLLFTINDNGQIVAEGTTWKKDRDYAQEAAVSVSAPKREDCKAWILNELDCSGGTIATKTLTERATTAGHSYQTLRKAKEELKASGDIRNTSTGNGKTKVWYVERVYSQGFIPVSDDYASPWGA